MKSFGVVFKLLAQLATALLVVGLTTAVSWSAPEDPPPVQTPKRAEATTPGTLTIAINGPEGVWAEGEVELYRWDPDGDFFDYMEMHYVSVETLPTTVEFTGLEPGAYYARYFSYTSSLSGGYLDGATTIPAEVDDPGVVTIETGQASNAAIALTSVTSVRGDVLGVDGTWLDGILVTATPTSGGETFTTTTSEGSFNLVLAPGTYTIDFSDPADLYQSQALPDPVVLEDGDTPYLDDVILQLLPPGSGQVSGTVIVPGQPDLAGVDIELLRVLDGGEDGRGERLVHRGQTASDGGFTVTGLRDGRDYTLAFRGPGVPRQYLGGGDWLGDADTFVGAAEVDLASIELVPGVTLGGVITDPDGSPVDAWVELHRYTEDWGFDHFTDAPAGDGGYAFDGLPPGHYAIHVQPDDPTLQATWLGGRSAPESVDDAGVFEVTAATRDVRRDVQLEAAPAVTGRVMHGGAPLSNASVTAYVWEGEGWSNWDSRLTNEAGRYRLAIEQGQVFTLRFARAGMIPTYLGGGDRLPASPTATNSRTSTGADLDLGVQEMEARVPTLGKVAGQDLAWCRSNVLERNDDSSSEAVDIPFDLKFFGDSYEQLYVNNNGNITFNDSLSQYTPNDLTGDTGTPIIAPFFADVDTSGADSEVVTYGASPDGKQFCVNWADVGYYSEGQRYNTFQLILSSNTAGAGRVAGDFDIRFNYDQVVWEAGTASDGDEDGLGGISAAVGFSNGSGAEGTFVQMPGSFENGALIDGGSHALIAGSQGSAQQGRYIFQVRNDGRETTYGGLTGRVVDAADDAPLQEAYVQVCRTSGTGCSYTETNAAGEYSFTALPAAAYDISVWPPSSDYFGGGARATVVSGDVTTVPDIRLAAPAAMPDNVTLDGVNAGGVPSLYYGDPIAFRMEGCAGVTNPTVTSTLANGRVIHNALPLTERPAGVYTATLPPFYPVTGDAAIVTNVPATCGAAPVSFNIYIDPAGVVTDQWGRPIVGAEVTLSRSDTADGEYTIVPDGSEIMSPSNRANPTRTNAVGFFRWDVAVGWYKVAATAEGCQPMTSRTMEVPPERVDLLLKLTCDVAAPAAGAKPALAGSGEVGSTLTATSGTWAEPLVEDALVWLRNGEVDLAIEGTTYTVQASDVGDTFRVRSIAARPDKVTDGGSAAEPEVIVFEAVSAESDEVKAVTKKAEPPVVASKASKTTLKLPKKIKAKKKAKAKVKVTVKGATATGKVTITIMKGKKTVKTVKVALKKGKATKKLPKLKKGNYTLVATYPGGTQIGASASKKAKLKVK